MNYSSQAIVIDTDRNIYLERNTVINGLSLFGGKLEQGESYMDAIQREIHEELGLNLLAQDFLGEEQQPVREFWNSRKNCYMQWSSVYYVVILQESQRELVQLRADIEVYSYEDFLGLDIGNFSLVDDKERYIKLYKRALSYLK